MSNKGKLLLGGHPAAFLGPLGPGALLKRSGDAGGTHSPEYRGDLLSKMSIQARFDFFRTFPGPGIRPRKPPAAPGSSRQPLAAPGRPPEPPGASQRLPEKILILASGRCAVGGRRAPGAGRREVRRKSGPTAPTPTPTHTHPPKIAIPRCGSIEAMQRFGGLAEPLHSCLLQG